MPAQNLTRSEQQQYEQYLALCDRIRRQTEVHVQETHTSQQKRVKHLLKDFSAFCKYYFPHYWKADFGKMHLDAADVVTKRKSLFMVAEWPRGFMKSVLFDIYLPLYLKARGELSGMALASDNSTKARQLLGPIQAELGNNSRLIADFGRQATLGDWRDGSFVTTDGVGFWAFGRNQSPRGTREGSNRPNYGVIDDIDDRVIVHNEERVKEAVAWVLEDFYGALEAQGGSRLVIIGNRIHHNSILANLVGDVNQGDPKRPGIVHHKVYATQDERGRPVAPELGRFCWHEYYGDGASLIEKFNLIGYRATQREYYHNPIQDGSVFRDEWIEWAKPLPISAQGREGYDAIVAYLDPSWKDSRSSDYKAWVVVGQRGNRYDVLKAWVRQATVKAMVAAGYDLYEQLGNHGIYYMEAGLMQDQMLADFDREGQERGYILPLRADRTAKADKVTRIENLSPLFERGLVRFSEREQQNPDMKRLIDQLLAFGSSAHDDGPDALEGAIARLAHHRRSAGFEPRLGGFRKPTHRRL